MDIVKEFINLITAQRAYQANARVITTSNTIKSEEKKEEVPKPQVSPEAVGVMYKLEPAFIVNLADPEVTMYVRVSITLELSSPQVVLEVQKREPIIRDAIIEILSNKTSRELRSPEGREQLKLEIIKRVNTILVQGASGTFTLRSSSFRPSDGSIRLHP